MNVVEQDEFEDEDISDITEEETEDSIEEEVALAPDIPDKFKDKSLGDIVQSYQSLESEYGRRNNEVGELRRLTDELLKLQLDEKEAETVKANTVDIDSLLDDPNTAINTAVDNNPRLQALEARFLQEERGKHKAKFESKHSDWQAIMGDAKFGEWIQGSQIRQDMFHKAHAGYDYDMADELFTNYKAIYGVAAKAETTNRTKKLKAATMESGSTGAKSTKIYRRTDLIQLRLRDPQKYDAMEADIMAAYADGRVK